MYSEYWGLTETPFSNTADPRWFFGAPGHEEAFARLMFVAEQRRRCGLLVGPRGAGKSLLLAVVEAQLRRTQREIVVVDLTGKTGDEWLWDLAAGLRLGPARHVRQSDMWRTLQDHLHASQIGMLPTVILADHPEAGTPDAHAALQRLVRLPPGNSLSVLIALENDAPALLQRFGSWADLRVELPALDRELTAQYITSRLANAGGDRPLFTSAAIDSICAHSHGLPRDINHLCELALVAASAFGADQVDQGTVETVANELAALRGVSPSPRLPKSA